MDQPESQERTLQSGPAAAGGFGLCSPVSNSRTDFSLCFVLLSSLWGARHVTDVTAVVQLRSYLDEEQAQALKTMVWRLLRLVAMQLRALSGVF